jgi:hypothetical protein
MATIRIPTVRLYVRERGGKTKLLSGSPGAGPLSVLLAAVRKRRKTIVAASWAI